MRWRIWNKIFIFYYKFRKTQKVKRVVFVHSLSLPLSFSLSLCDFSTCENRPVESINLNCWSFKPNEWTNKRTLIFSYLHNMLCLFVLECLPNPNSVSTMKMICDQRQRVREGDDKQNLTISLSNCVNVCIRGYVYV